MHWLATSDGASRQSKARLDNGNQAQCIAVQDALIVVTYTHRLWSQGWGLEEGARLAAERRLRPVLMTTSVAMLGPLPAGLSRGIGSETQKPLAIVVIGGALARMWLPRLIQAPLLVLAGHLRAAHGPRGEIPPVKAIRAKCPGDVVAAVAPAAVQPRSSSWL